MHRKLRILFALLAMAALIATLASAQLQVRGQPSGPPDRGDKYLVSFRPGTTQSERAAAVRLAGALLRFNYNIVDAVAVTAPNVNVLLALQRHPAVTGIVPDRPVYAFQNAKAKPGGGGTVGQVIPEGVTRVGVPRTGSDGTGIGVAIVDTGIDFNHRDLAVVGSYSAFAGTSCQDDNGHGTHVAGTVAALDNEVDVVGIAPKATLYCVKVLDRNGSGSDSTVIAGLEWIAGNPQDPPIRVVNMSLGRAGTLDDSPPLRGAVQTLYSNGVVVVTSAGNNSSREVSQMVPAGYPEVFAVASTTAKDGTNACKALSRPVLADTASYFTTDGKFENGIGVTISAPGEDQENVSRACMISSVGILSTKLGGGTTRMSGTSMAAPHVAGVVARMIQAEVLQNVESIRSTLKSRADRIGTAPLDSPASGYTFDGEREGIAQAP